MSQLFARKPIADLLAGSEGGLRRVMGAGDLIGLAFDPRGGLVLVSHDTAFRLNVPVRGLLSVSHA